MPFLPTLASICGIISCFQSAGSLFTAVNSRKEASKRHREVQDEKAEAKAAEKVSKALTLGKSEVQYEYDRSLARIGPQFATGDQTGCMQLMSEMLKMQQQVISVLHSALIGGHLDMNQLTLATNMRTDNTISVLKNQYQRMATYEESWISKEWKGGYVEDKSVPHSPPRAAFEKIHLEGKSAPSSPHRPIFRKGEFVENKSTLPSPTASFRKRGHTRNDSTPSTPAGSRRSTSCFSGSSVPISPRSTLGTSCCSTMGSAPSSLGSSVSSSFCAGHESTTRSPTATLWGGEYVKLKSDPASSRGGLKNGGCAEKKSAPKSPNASLWDGEYAQETIVPFLSWARNPNDGSTR